MDSGLEAPAKVSLLAQSESQGPSPFPYWQYPFETTFRGPLLSQRQILIEASRRRSTAGTAPSSIELVETVLRRYPEFLRPLTRRGRGRDALAIRDEYDVQDTVHAILRLFFDDIRPEEWTPSYAGAAARVDFLIKREQMVVEVKVTRAGLTRKEVGEQLIIDIARYKTHPDCKTLLAFVYDPERRVENSQGLESDLSGVTDGLLVRVLVVRG